MFNSIQEVVHSSKTLLRLSQLDSFITESADGEIGLRIDNIQLLRGIWEKAKEELKTSYERAFNTVKAEVSSFTFSFPARYLEDFAKIEDGVQLEKFLDRNLNDLTSLQRVPVRKSHRGNKGPTLLVHYPRYKKDTNNRIQYVIKWTHWNEILCTRVYGMLFSLLKNIALEEGYYEIRVPKTVGLDFTTCVFENRDGQSSGFSKEESEALMKNYFKISTLYTSKEIDASQQIMLSDTVRGENLFDFIKSKYQYLSLEQKQNFYRSLAVIGMTDLIIGNLDRLTQVNFSLAEKTYQLEVLESNFGNVMISWVQNSNENPILYAIDNGIDDDVIAREEHREKYLVFLRGLLNTPEFEKIIAENMVESFQGTLRSQIDDEEGNVSELKKDLEIFTQDLKQIAFDNFAEGITWINTVLHTRLIPLFEAEYLSSIKTHPVPLFNDLHTALNERLAAFKESRS